MKDISNWSHNQVLEWLSFLICENKEIPPECESIFIDKKLSGNDLLFLQKKNFVDLGISENISHYLDKQINDLLISTGFNLSKKRFQLKLEGFLDYKHLDSKNFLKKHKDKVFSLCDETLILKSYLCLDVDSFDEQIYKKDQFECKLILTEMVYNSYELGLSDTFKSKINCLNFYDPKKKFGNFKCALIIGGIWYLEFGDTSLCVPKRLGKNVKKLYEDIPPFAIINLKINEIELKLAKIISEWNCNYMYKDWDSKLSKFEGNCFHFVEEILKQFQIDTKYNGSLYSFMNEIKNFGDAGPSIYPTDYSSEFQQKFQFSCIPEVLCHDFFDEILCLIDQKEPDFKKKFLHDFLVFQAIDIAFVLRSMKSDDENFEPLMEIDSGHVCPNFHLHDKKFAEFEENCFDLHESGQCSSSPFSPSPKRKSDSKSKLRKSVSNNRKSLKNTLKVTSPDNLNVNGSRFSQNFRDRSGGKDGISNRIDRFSMSILKTMKSNPK